MDEKEMGMDKWCVMDIVGYRPIRLDHGNRRIRAICRRINETHERQNGWLGDKGDIEPRIEGRQ
jgi:hypothetical protein